MWVHPTTLVCLFVDCGGLLLLRKGQGWKAEPNRWSTNHSHWMTPPHLPSITINAIFYCYYPRSPPRGAWVNRWTFSPLSPSPSPPSLSSNLQPGEGKGGGEGEGGIHPTPTTVLCTVLYCTVLYCTVPYYIYIIIIIINNNKNPTPQKKITPPLKK